MLKRKKSPYSFYARKQHYKARHKKTFGLRSFGWLNGMLDAIRSNLLQFVTIFVAAAVVIAVVLVVATAPPVVQASGDAAEKAAADASGDAAQPSQGEFEDYDEEDYMDVDEETLAGLTGESGDASQDSTGDISEAEMRGAIGVVFDNVDTAEETTILQKIEKASQTAIGEGKIGLVKYYYSESDMNQQLQYMRTLVNSNAKAVIIAVADRETYVTMAKMAHDAGIPVVAINAPVEEGYAVNVVEDTSQWGSKTADFLKQHLFTGNYIEVVAKKQSDLEKQRLEKIRSAAAALNKAGSVKPENKSSSIKKALQPLVKPETPVHALITGNGMAKNALNALLSLETVPNVFLGDATVGCLKLWRQFKTTGIEIEREVAPAPAQSDEKDKDEKPKTEKVTLKADKGEVFCAESAPYGVGGTAFQFALRFGEGKKLKDASGNVYRYSSTFLITDANLEQYYERFKDEKDGYVISDWISDAEIDAMFE